MFLKFAGPVKPFDSPVAFTAGLSETFTVGNSFDVVLYDVNLLNHGDHYE